MMHNKNQYLVGLCSAVGRCVAHGISSFIPAIAPFMCMMLFVGVIENPASAQKAPYFGKTGGLPPFLAKMEKHEVMVKVLVKDAQGNITSAPAKTSSPGPLSHKRDSVNCTILGRVLGLNPTHEPP